MLRRGTIIALLAVAAAPGVARADSAAVCTFEAEVHISPGVSMTAGDSTFFTPDGGVIDCTGFIQGREITGPGTIHFQGRGGDGWLGGETCLQDTSVGTLSMLLPDTSGDTGVVGDFLAQRVGVAGAFDGSLLYVGAINGAFEFIAAEGQDCVSTPVTRATVIGQAVFGG